MARTPQKPKKPAKKMKTEKNSISTPAFPKKLARALAPRPTAPAPRPTPVGGKTRSPYLEEIAASIPPFSGKKGTLTHVAGQTQIMAQIDVGIGNTLSIRGQGAGLSWEKGEAMQWIKGAWVWNTISKESFEFKVLLNDQQWQTGENLKASAGAKVAFTPAF